MSVGNLSVEWENLLDVSSHTTKHVVSGNLWMPFRDVVC